MISPVLNQICGDFCHIIGIENDTKLAYYQLTGLTKERITKYTSKLIVTLENQDVTFESDSQEIYNVVTKSVVPRPASNEIVSHFEIGQEFYSKFLEERICGEVSIWSPLKKRNIGSFKSIAKRLTTKGRSKRFQHVGCNMLRPTCWNRLHGMLDGVGGCWMMLEGVG